jgi:hypothetical protein
MSVIVFFDADAVEKCVNYSIGSYSSQAGFPAVYPRLFQPKTILQFLPLLSAPAQTVGRTGPALRGIITPLLRRPRPAPSPAPIPERDVRRGQTQPGGNFS